MSSISANGATQIIYISEIAGSIFYRIGNGSATQVSSWPFTINNSNPSSSSILKLFFETNITLDSTLKYFICGSSYLQFGSTSLNTDGSRSVITIDGVSNYPGVIQNGTGTNASANIYIYNLYVSSNSSTLKNGSGWIGHEYFGAGSSGSILVNCSSDGTISDFGGGIVGQASGGSIGGSLVIRGCSSSGSSSASTYAGGIAGNGAGGSYGSIVCEQCWSTGDIGTESGGIFGSYGGVNNGSATATKCYSEGTITNNGGGIFGSYAAESIGSALAQKCYSRGAIQGGSGGIFGVYAGDNFGGTSYAINCYSSGAISTSGNGIYGSNKLNGTATNCYSANNSWSDSSAAAALQGIPSGTNLGDTWVRIVANTPYELNAMGYIPYSIEIIDSSSQLIQSFSENSIKGDTSTAALNADASGNSFTILDKSGGNSEFYTTITINAQTGAISTKNTTPPGTYTITVRSIGSYNITRFILTVIDDSASSRATCCVTTFQERGVSYEWMNQYKIGNTLLIEQSQKPPLKFNDYSEYVKYKMSQGSRKF